MDPNETLRRLRVVAGDVLDYPNSPHTRTRAILLAEKFTALDGWLSQGKQLPGSWEGRQ